MAVLAVAVVIGLVAIIGLRPAPVGPSASASAGPSVSLGQKPSLRAFLREVNDRPESLTFYLGLLDGTALYQETLSGSQLGEEAWFGPFGQAFLRLGVEGEQWTVDLLTTADPTPRRIHADDARITALTLSPDGAWLYLSRADAASGDDLGIWRLPVAGGDLSQVLEPDAQRPTPPRASASVLFWTPDGSQLLVQHCRGDRVPGDDCTWTRVRGGTGEALGEITPSAPAGIIVGIADDRLLAGADCDGLSCTASLVDFATGEVTDVDVPGARETLIESSAGPILLRDERSDIDGYTITATELDSGRTWTAYQTGAPIYELVTFEGGAGAVQLDPGWFAVAMEGQLGAAHAAPPVLVNALDGTQFVMTDLVPEVSATPAASPTPSPTAPSSPPPGYEVQDDLPITVLANEEADALFAEVDTCVSAAGYTVEFPASWYTNSAVGDTPACSWFGPEPFEVAIRPVATKPPPPDGVWITLQVFDGGAGYTSLTPVYFSEDVTIDGYTGHRAEFGHSTLDEIESDPDYRAYWYLIPLGRVSPTFIAETGMGQADDYPLAKAVLDRMVASATFESR